MRIIRSAIAGLFATAAYGASSAVAETGSVNGALPELTVETVVVSAAREAGPDLSLSGNSDFHLSEEALLDLPAGVDTTLTDALAQMPGVAIDQNQQIHIRDTEGPQFQYQINGVLVPLDINTNPPFVSMINPSFIKDLGLQVGALPARYSYATGGVVDIETKNGCDERGGSLMFLGGERGTLEPSLQYGGCDGAFSYYVSTLFEESDTAFSSATPGPNAIHDRTNQGQGFGFFTYDVDAKTQLSLVASTAASNNQLPNVPNLAPEFVLAGVTPPPSESINSYLDFRDYLGILALKGTPTADFSYQLAYSVHSIAEDFLPDDVGELVYQGVASTASHKDFDNTFEGDLNWTRNAHTLGAGFYLGVYRVAADDRSLVFPVNPLSGLTGETPVTVVNDASATNVVGGVYVDDLWQLSERLKLNLGLRWDTLTGFTRHSQIDPTINLSYQVEGDTTLHAGFARYMQVPSFQGIAPSAPQAFENTTAAGPAGIATPTTEDDVEWDVGFLTHFTPKLTLSEDNYYEITHHYLDTGQFGVVPIFAPFNYEHGTVWGDELALNYKDQSLSAYANLTLGQNLQEGVATGQFNFDPDELAYIDSHHIVLDHQPLFGASFGATYDWKPWSFSIDGNYSSGLRAGFADEERLPADFQLNASVERAFDIPGVGQVVDRLVFINVLDRVNLIRPAEGIGIFQSAYGPRFTVYDALTIPL